MNEQNRADLRDKSKAELEALKAEVQAALDAKAVVARFEAEVRATTTAPIEARIALLEGAMGEAVGALEPFARIADMEERAGPADSVMVNVARCRDARTTLASPRAMLADDGEK